MKVRTLALGLSALFYFSLLSTLRTGEFRSGYVPATPQEDVTSLRVNVRPVLVEVVVLDDKGKPLPGLKSENFRIFLDDREQQINAFDAASEEPETSPLPSSRSDINERTQRGKVVLFLFDQSTIGAANSKLAFDSAEQYVHRHMHPYDAMGVAVYGQSLRITCPLTHDASKVIEALQKANEAFADSAGRMVRGTPGAKELRWRVLDVFRGLKSLCSSLEPVRGRKTVLLFTEDTVVPTDILDEYNSLVTEARKSDVIFFTIDAPGQSASSLNSASVVIPDTGGRLPQIWGEVSVSQFQNKTSSTIFRSLASHTNGYPIYGGDNLTAALDRVNQELGHYYVLGFQSDSARTDGKPHKIEVKVNLKNVRLRYRDTFTDPHPIDPLAGSKGEDSLRMALSSSVRATELPVHFRAVYFYETPQVAQIPVFVKIGRGSIALKKKGGHWTGHAGVMGVAVAEDGTTASRFSGEVNIDIGQAQVDAFQNQDLDYRNFLRLKPGKYRLKLVVLDENGKKGTAEQDLSVPIFNERGMTASSLVLSQELVPLPALIRELKPRMLAPLDPMQFRGFQIYPPMQVEMDPQQPLLVFYRIYSAPSGGADRAFKINVQALDEMGESHSFSPIDSASSVLPAGQGEAAIGFTLPCRNLKPGKYRLRVETAETGSGQVVMSEADFRLRGSDRDLIRSAMPRDNSEQTGPPARPAVQDTSDVWAPPDVDRTALQLVSGASCALPEVLAGAAKRIQELIQSVESFTATEVLEHQDADRRGNLQAAEIRKFDYMVSIRELRGGFMNVEEFRDGDYSPTNLPGQIATFGTSSIVLIFHPRYVPDFDMVCEGLSNLDGQPAWQVRFEQRKDRLNYMRTYHIDGVRFDIRLRGRAWIKADNFEVVRLETDLADQIPKIQLRAEHMTIEYAPVDFPERNIRLWLPKSAELYVDFRGHRFRRRHHFTDFKLFSVETRQEIAPPKPRNPDP
jgi:VWFA-related protein